ncbi:hypothetical protein MNV49_000894 [Pseudohyphozyma bogoriensis]|nr:hypothetical protein MNV49_000894 [Pseudohyphozyma bogoriensis]
MRVFITGATGWVGTAVSTELVAHGHTVVGLARSDASAEKLTKAGYEVHRGSLEDLDSITAGVESADGVIHCGFIHDFTSMESMANSVKVEMSVLGAIGAALEGTTKPLVVSSGCAGLRGPNGEPGEEDTEHARTFPRAGAEAYALSLADKGIHVSVVSLVRLPPTTHGVGEQHGFMKRLIQAAQKTGNAGYIGDGHNTWPAGHISDAATLYRLALERSAIGGKYHAVGEPGVSLLSIAETIAKKLGVPTQSLTPEEGRERFGFLAMIMGMDSKVLSEKTQKELGWKPSGPGLLEDLERDEYYQ